MSKVKTYKVTFEVTTQETPSIISYLVVRSLSSLVLDSQIGEFKSLTVKEKD